mmetsp:Transcript_38184/g.75140  ORF Transcript_38184/g.75140 Transcript_38184/m.75140 type:complete len:318 (-) Transcript_38184:740-1693(-)
MCFWWSTRNSYLHHDCLSIPTSCLAFLIFNQPGPIKSRFRINSSFAWLLAPRIAEKVRPTVPRGSALSANEYTSLINLVESGTPKSGSKRLSIPSLAEPSSSLRYSSREKQYFLSTGLIPNLETPQVFINSLISLNTSIICTSLSVTLEGSFASSNMNLRGRMYRLRSKFFTLRQQLWAGLLSFIRTFPNTYTVPALPGSSCKSYQYTESVSSSGFFLTERPEASSSASTVVEVEVRTSFCIENQSDSDCSMGAATGVMLLNSDLTLTRGVAEELVSQNSCFTPLAAALATSSSNPASKSVILCCVGLRGGGAAHSD